MPSPRTGSERARSLDREALHRVARATTAVLASGLDVTVLDGASCFVRVLDDRRIAVPDGRLDAESVLRANLAEAPEIGLLLVGPGSSGGRRGLQLRGRAEVVPAERLTEDHPDLPRSPGGRATEVWVVVDIDDVRLLDGADVPPLGGDAPADPYGAPEPREPVERAHWVMPTLAWVPTLTWVVVLLVIVALAVAVGVGVGVAALGRPGGDAASSTAGPAGPATLYGRVVDVPSVDRVVVDVGGTPVTVDVIGLDEAAVPACARDSSLAFARSTLGARMVTLVPDPTLPPASGARGYLVLPTQLSYTDAAISAGASPAVGPSQYQAVFDREQSQAQEDRSGMWGPPCVR